MDWWQQLTIIVLLVGYWWCEWYLRKGMRADRDQWRRKLTEMIAELRGFVAEARLGHTCDNCPPSVPVVDVEFAIEEADDENRP